MAKCRSRVSAFEIPVSEWKHMMKMRGKEELTPVEKLFSYTFHVVGWFWNVFSFYPWYIFTGNYKQKRLDINKENLLLGNQKDPTVASKQLVL